MATVEYDLDTSGGLMEVSLAVTEITMRSFVVPFCLRKINTGIKTVMAAKCILSIVRFYESPDLSLF